jgi:phage tail protein X
MYLSHTTIDGERWDTIAHRYYGNVSQMAQLIAANPHIPITETLTGGQVLAIPIIDEEIQQLSELPSWKL